MRWQWTGCAVVAMALLLGSAVPAWAAQWQRTFTLSGPATVRLDTSQGGVVVSAWDQNQVAVTVRTQGWSIGPNGVRVDASQAGAAISIRIQTPRHSWSWGDHGVHVTLQVPRQTQIHLHTDDGDLRLSGVHGPVWLRTGDGDILGRNLQAPHLVARTGDGNIRLDGQFAALEAGTGDGDIHLQADAGSRVANAWMLRSGDGNLAVSVPDRLGAEVDARTGDGSIRFDAPVQVNGPLDPHHVHGKLHGGGGLIALRSGDGSITLAAN